MKQVTICILVIGAALGHGCGKNSCISQPFSHVTSDRQLILDLAGKLDKLKVASGPEAKFTVDYKKVVDESYQELSESGTALFLCLQAIDCYLLRAAKYPELLPVIEDLIPDLTNICRSGHGAKEGISGMSKMLDDNERDAIDKSIYAPLIYARYRQFGVE